MLKTLFLDKGAAISSGFNPRTSAIFSATRCKYAESQRRPLCGRCKIRCVVSIIILSSELFYDFDDLSGVFMLQPR